MAQIFGWRDDTGRGSSDEHQQLDRTPSQETAEEFPYLLPLSALGYPEFSIKCSLEL